MSEYDFRALEEKWLPVWEKLRPFEADEQDETKPRKYVLDMFSYPSGDLHMGHAETYAYGDIISRYWRHRGYNVLHPIGWDSFGLPAENAAIKHGINPRTWTYSNIEQQANSMRLYAPSFDWSRRLHTSDPEYYRWNQWLFLQLYERGLAYRKEAWVNWDPVDQTVLANEQVLPDGTSERSGALVVKKKLTQWFLKITDYAQRLLDDLELLQGAWSDRVLAMQRNWIGRSEGANISFKVPVLGRDIEVFTTRADTLFGVTFLVVAPDSELAQALAEKAGLRAESAELQRKGLGDAGQADKEGLSLDAFALHPITGQQIPIWAANYVLSDYGQGAVMAVPAHDKRDGEFAEKYALPILQVIDEEAQTLVNSPGYDGKSVEQARAELVSRLQGEGLGGAAVSYRMRDWLISRQRYWGTPIPIMYRADGTEVPVDPADLPIKLPEAEGMDLTPKGTSPLGAVQDWVQVTNPDTGEILRRDTDTMDTFVDSSWYFLRYLNPNGEDAAFTPEQAAKWGPVDQYCGGIEHAVLHLLYARFITKFLYDIGAVNFSEPFKRLINQGMVILNGAKMSKSKGNVVSLAEELGRHGVDVVRLSLTFAGPPEDDVDWKDVSTSGAAKFLARALGIARSVESAPGADYSQGDPQLRRHVHQLLADVDELVDAYRFNVIIARLMDLSNVIRRRSNEIGGADPAVREAAEVMAMMLDMFSPYVAEEMWQILGHEPTVGLALWPEADRSLLEKSTAWAIVQVNGKLRDRVEVPLTIDEAELVELARTLVARTLEGKSVKKVICLPPKLVNFVV